MSDPTSTQTPENTVEIVRALNGCIETCTDGEKGYGAAAADVRAADLKHLCLESAKQRGAFVLELQAAIRKLGSFPENEGTFSGAVRRDWMTYRRLVEGPDDRVVLEGCADGEKASMRAYEAADRAVLHPAPDEIRALVQHQYAAILSAHSDIRARLGGA